MILNVTAEGRVKTLKLRCSELSRILFPLLFSFVCISLFLFLSFMIIEGYSLSQMMESDRVLSRFSDTTK
jgi:hypothetical protein